MILKTRKPKVLRCPALYVLAEKALTQSHTTALFLCHYIKLPFEISFQHLPHGCPFAFPSWWKSLEGVYVIGCMHACVRSHVWVDRVIGPVKVLGSAQGAWCWSICTAWCSLSCGGVGKWSHWTSEGTEEEWGNCRQIGLMVVLKEEVVGPTAASHLSGLAWTGPLVSDVFTFMVWMLWDFPSEHGQ